MNVDSFVRDRLSSAVDHEPIDIESHLRAVRNSGAAATGRAARRRWTVAVAALAAAGAAVALAVWSFSNHRSAVPDYRPTPSVTATPGRTEPPSRAPRHGILSPPSGPEVQAAVRVPFRPEAMTASGGSVWVLGPDRVVRIDPSKNHIDTSFQLPPVEVGFTPMISDGRRGVWFAHGDAVWHLDATGSGARPIVVGVRAPRALALGGSRLWVLSEGSIVALDPASGRRIDSFEFRCACGGLAYFDGSLWTDDVNLGVSRIDPGSGRIVARIAPIEHSALVIENGTLWALGDPGVSRIDANTNTARQTDSITEFEGYASVTATVGDGAIWANGGGSGMSSGSSVVQEISPISGRVVGRVDVFHVTQGGCRLAVAAHGLWQACTGTRYRGNHGRIIGVLPEGYAYVVRTGDLHLQEGVGGGR